MLLRRADAGEESDPIVGKFLAFLVRDMEALATEGSDPTKCPIPAERQFLAHFLP